MDEHYHRIFSRNSGLLIPEEQERLRRANIAVAGAGGVGGLLAERLIRLGVGNLRITDPGIFETSNLNRQFSATRNTLGQLKVESILSQIKDINPQARIQSNAWGIRTTSDAEELVEGSDLVIDEMDYGAWKESVFLQRAARKRGLYYLFASAIGFGALAVIFEPGGITLEEFNRMPLENNPAESEATSAPRGRVLPEVPSYAGAGLTPGMIEEIIQGRKPVPTCSIGAGLAAMLAATEAVNILLKRREIISAPGYVYVDLLDRRFKIGKFA
jgi:tRNA threonylcarbamoyladenosine dehydratase